MPRSKRFVQRDELDSLLAEALAHQLNRNRGKGTVTRVKEIEAEIHSTFSNPADWDETGLVLITYIDEKTGETTQIGLFQELVHRRTKARRLSRRSNDFVDQSTDTVQPREWLTNDEFLVHPPLVAAPPATPANPYERLAIRDYLSRIKEQKLSEFLGKPDADKLLAQLRDLRL